MSAGSNDEAHEWSAAFATASTDGMEAYDDALVGPMFTPWGEYLLDALTVTPGERLLDVATGPGTVARLASARLGPAGHVLATDLSAAMLAIAEAKGTVANGSPITVSALPCRSPLQGPRSTWPAASMGSSSFQTALALWRRCVGRYDPVAEWVSPYGPAWRCAPHSPPSGTPSVRSWASKQQNAMPGDRGACMRRGPWRTW